MRYNNFKTLMKNTTQQSLSLKTIFAFAAFLLFGSGMNVWGETETHPSSASSDTEVSGTSYSIPSTLIAGIGGTQAGTMTSKGVKFRLNKTVDSKSNVIKFAVTAGYAITQIDFNGHTNDNSKTNTITKVEVDGVEITWSEVALTNKTSSTEFSISGISATSAIYLYVSGTGTQANLEYTITYSVASSTTYTVSYDANGGSGSMTDDDSPYSSGATVIVLDNAFTAPTGKEFSHWNTASDGSGTSYNKDDTFTASDDVTLYAQWANPCSPTIDASCLADAWAPGIDYLKNAPATITWNCIATSSGGDNTKLRYKWYRYPVSHPELVEEAEGTNDQATFTPSSTDLHDWMEYYCRVTEVGCTGHADTHTTGAVRIVSLVNGWVVFEGELFDALVSSPVSYYPASGVPTHPGTITYTIGSTPTIVDVSKKTNNYDVTKNFTKGVQISKSTSGYFQFTIPDNYTATFKYAFSGTGNRTIMLASEKINSTTADGYIATLTSAVKSETIEGGEYTTDLTAGTYYICESGSGNWQIVELIFDLQPAGADCAPTITTGSAVSWAGGAVYTKDDVVSTPLFTVVASASNGGTLTYKWKSFPAVGGSKATAVDAAGTNDQASYTPPTNVVHEDYIYFCVVGETGCSGTAETELTGAVRVNPKPVTGWIIFDGSTDDALRTSPIKYWDGTAFDDTKVTLSYEAVSPSNVKDISGKTNKTGNDKTYLKGQEFGTTTTSSKYIAVTIPDGYLGTFTYAYCAGGTNRSMYLGTSIQSSDIATLGEITGSSSNLIGGTYSTQLSSGTYYFGFNNTIQLAELIFDLVEDACTPPTNTSATFGGKGDYKIGDTPVLSFTASATPSNGGEISYQWYQNTSGTKEGAVIADPDADGYNNRATYTPSTASPGTHFYYCVMKEEGCSKSVETELSGIVTVSVPPTTGWILFDGEMHSEMQSSPVYYYDGTSLATSGVYMTYRTVGSLSAKDVSTKTNDGNYKTYTTGIQTGGTTSSSNNYLEFTIPEGTRATSFSWAFGSTGNNRTIHLGTKPASTEDDIALLCTFPASGGTLVILSGKYTSTIEAGTYYISSLDGGACQYVDLNFTLEATCTAPTNTSPIFGGKADYKIGDTPVLSFTASATPSNGGEISYQWYQNTSGTKEGAVIADPDADGYNNRATYTPSTASPGTHFYYCVMTESGCPFTVETGLSGIVQVNGCDDETIINATLTGTKTADVTGTIGGTANVNLNNKDAAAPSGYKLGDNGKYFMVSLTGENFKADDVISIDVTKESANNKLFLYKSATAGDYFAEISDVTSAGIYTYTLTQSDIDAGITNTIGLYREGMDQIHNPNISSISVERLVCYCTPPTITVQPTGTASAICSDAKHTLTVEATGGVTPYTYKWYKDGTNQTGRTTASIDINTAEDAGEWYCEIYGADDCFSRSKTVTVEVKTKATIAWDTEPADGKVDAPWTHPSVTTNYADGVTLSSNHPEYVTIEWNTTDEVWDLKYIAVGSATITATVTGADEYCGTASVSKLVTVSAPDCDAYSFHWGTEGADGWELKCFEQVGSTTMWLTPLFTVPAATGADWDEISANQSKKKYYVGWKGSWNDVDAKSADGYFYNSMPYALIASDKSTPVYPDDYSLIGAAREGNVGGAQGYLRIYDDSGDKNKFVGFIPAGYAVRLSYQTNADPEEWDNHEFIPLLAASEDKLEKHWLSNIVTITEDMLKSTTRFDVDLKTADSYVWAENKSYWNTPLGNIGVRSTNDSWRGTAFAADDAGMKGKFAIWADSKDVNWAIYFIPYIGITFDLNGGDSWSGTAPEPVSIEGDDAARTLTIPTEVPVREGYLFIGWNTSSTATTSSNNPGTTVILTNDIKLYAVWEKVVTVTGSDEVEEDKTITLTPSEAGGTWSSADATIASVADGVVTGHKAGETTTITYTKGTQTISHTVTVTCQFVEIISYNAIATGKTELTDQEATGSIGGTGSQKLTGDGNTKLNGTGNYIFVTLARGNFQNGDRIKIVISAVPGTEETKRLSVFTTNADDGWYKDISDVTEVGTYTLELGSDLPTTNTIGLRRTDTYKQNASITSITVVRPNCSKLIKPEVSITGHETAICSGDDSDITLTANVTTGTADSYQWYADDVAISGATASTYTFTPTPLNVSTEYKVEALNALFTSDKSAAVTITFKPGVISGPTEVMRTQDIELTANAVGGTWSISNGNAALSEKVDADGKSKVTLTGIHEGSVVVSYTLDGCENKYNIDITEYIICNTFAATADRHYDFTDGTILDYATTSGNTSTSKTGVIASKNNICEATRIVYTTGDFLIKFPVSVTKIILYCSNASNILSVSSIKTTDEPKTSGTSYTDYTTYTSVGGTDKGCQEITITCTDGNYISADKWVWIKLSQGTSNTYQICYRPVDCSYLDVTPSGTTTLDYNESVTLTATITDGVYTTTDDDKITIVDNGDGTATITAKSLAADADATAVYTRPNGCSVETSIHVNRDPCPFPTVNLYTNTYQLLGTGATLILSAQPSDVETPVVQTYQWYKNNTASETGATEITGATTADYITTTESFEGTMYYFIKVTNTVGDKTKSINSDFIAVTTSSSCKNRILINADIHTGTSNIEDTFEADGGIIGGTLLQKTSKVGKLDNDNYVILQLATGNFQAGDIIKIQATSYAKKALIFSYNNDAASFLSDKEQTKTDDSGNAEYTLTQADIDNGVTNKIGLYRDGTITKQNPTMTSISVERPYCFDDQTTCLDDIVNFSVCNVASASGYTYQWKIDGVAAAGTQYSFTTKADANDHTITCDIIKSGNTKATETFTITGDNTDFHFAMNRTAYYKGMTDELIPDEYGHTWSYKCKLCNTDGITSCPHAKIETIGGKYIFTPLTSDDNEITVFYTNANGCYHSKMVTCSNPYFVFKSSIDNKWSTVGNWHYSTSNTTYKILGETDILPNTESRVILIDSCAVDIPNALAQYVRIAHGETADNTGNGRLTILPTGALTIASTLQKFEADGTKFGTGQKITAGDIRILSNESGVGALAFMENNASMLPEAEVSYYFRPYYDKSRKDEANYYAQWQYVGVPFSDAAPFHYFFYGGYIEKWEESQYDWVQIKNGSDESLTSPEAFRGYAFTKQGTSEGYYNSSTGTLNPTQTKALHLDYSNTAIVPGRNLFANSWTSPIYVDAEDGAITFSPNDAAEKTFYVFNTGTYSDWTDYEYNSVNSEIANPDVSPTRAAPGQYIAIPVNAASYVGINTIAPMQGFFIHTNKAGTLTIDYSKAVQNLSQTTKSTHPRYAPSRSRKDENIQVTTFTLIGETGGDNAFVLTGNEDFTQGFDNGWDGRKLEANPDVPYLALLTSGGRMQISAQPELLGSMLSFRAGDDDYYELVITTTETDLMLKDMLTEMLVPLRDTTIYSFYADNKYMTPRFCIVKKPEIATTISNESGSLLNAFLCDGEIVVTNMTGEAINAGLYDATGKLIQIFNAATGLTTIDKPSAQGVYLIRLNDRTFKITL